MLRRLGPHWSAVFLAASLLFCAAILLQPLIGGGLGSSVEANQSADPIGSRTNLLNAAASIDKAVPGLEPGAPVVRASAWAR